MHVIAAKAVAFKEALQPAFKDYQAQVVKNAQAMATHHRPRLQDRVGWHENHLMLVDMIGKRRVRKGRGGAGQGPHHGQQERGAERPAQALRHLRPAHRHAGGDHARLQGSRTAWPWPNGSATCWTPERRAGHRRRARQRRKQCRKFPVYGWLAARIADRRADWAMHRRADRRHESRRCSRRSPSIPGRISELMHCPSASTTTPGDRSARRRGRRDDPPPPRSARACGERFHAGNHRPENCRRSSSRMGGARASMRASCAPVSTVRCRSGRCRKRADRGARCARWCTRRMVGERELAPAQGREFVMGELRKLDHVGYVRFASVYCSFEDVADFRERTDRLEREHRRGPSTLARRARWC